MSILTSVDGFPLKNKMGSTSFQTTEKDFASFTEVHLSNTDLQKSIAFWTNIVGMKLRKVDGVIATFGTVEKTLVVVHQTATKPFVEGFSGLYHFAIHATNAQEFAKMIQRLINNNYPFSPTDHTMSKSVYLRDPDGITIEFALETPERFKRIITENGLWIEDVNGEIHSASAVLNLDEILQELKDKSVKEPIHEDTKIGHFHFYVSNLEEANQFYKRAGFISFNHLPQYKYADVGMQSAYKHRIAMNMWHGKNKPLAPQHHAGLKYYTIVYQSKAKLDSVMQECSNVKKQNNKYWLSDPTGILICFQSA